MELGSVEGRKTLDQDEILLLGEAGTCPALLHGECWTGFGQLADISPTLREAREHLGEGFAGEAQHRGFSAGSEGVAPLGSPKEGILPKHGPGAPLPQHSPSSPLASGHLDPSLQHHIESVGGLALFKKRRFLGEPLDSELLKQPPVSILREGSEELGGLHEGVE